MSAHFDVGPLTWVQGEIHLALTRTAEALQNYGAHPADTAPLKFAQTHLHQASGALAIVGLEGLTRVAEAVERVMEALQQGQIASPGESTAVCQNALKALVDYLDDLLNGADNQPLQLLPVYAELVALLGITEVSPADLFFPDLSPLLPPRAAAAPPEAELPLHLRQVRGAFQRGLLKWLRQDASGLNEMQAAVAAVEQTQNHSSTRAFWWVSMAMIDALRAGDLNVDNSIKKLCARIDLQIRKLREGARTVPERLLRELLYRVAIANPGSSQVARVRDVYGLDGQLPEPAAVKSRQVAPHALREALAAAKDDWDNYAAGSATALPRFKQHLAAVHDGARTLAQVDLLRLCAALDATVAPLDNSEQRPGSALALEVASALLLVDGAVDEIDHLGSEFPQLVDAMAARLAALRRGDTPASSDLSRLKEISRQAQERLLLSQVGREMLANLGQVEQGLDAFFRDPEKRGTLLTLAQALDEVRGVLSILGEERAAALLHDCSRRIDALAAGVSRPEETVEFEAIARQLSAIGFFVGALHHGGADIDAMLGATASTAATATGETNDPFDGTPSAAAAALAPQDPPAAAATAATTGAPEGGDSTVLLANAAQIDAELLAIFIEEARELLDTVATSLPRCIEQPHDLQNLTVIRRAFHTLKGSGRMVGLVDFAQVAFAVEKVLNLWLKNEQNTTPAVHEMLRQARALFGAWVADLETDTRPEHDAGGLLSLCARLTDVGSDAQTADMPETPGPTSIHDMYCAEARGHIALLQQTVAAWSASASPPPDSMLRAAHTLAGISATVGNEPVGVLARALERALERALQRAGNLAGGAAGEDLAPLVQAIDALQMMLDALARGEPVPALSGQAVQLDAWLTPVGAAPMLGAALSVATAAAEGRTLQLRDEFDAQLLPIFVEEAEDLLRGIGSKLRSWRNAPGAAELPQQLLRLLHTLKGSARMAGAMGFGELVHGLETRIGQYAHMDAEPGGGFDELDASFDQLLALRETLVSGRSEAGAPAAAAPAAASAASAADSAATALTTVQPTPLGQGAQLRVRADLIDALVNEAGEIAIARTRIEGEVRTLKTSLLDLSESVISLRTYLREIELQADTQMQSQLAQTQEVSATFDPLEMDRYTRFQEVVRMMAESVNDVGTVQQSLLRNVDHTHAAIAAQARLNRELSQALMGVRMLPFDSVADRLYRVVRQSAKEAGRRANLDIRGGEVEIDRSVLEKIIGPIEHLLRNAVAHGIEARELRLAAGKPEIGEIILALKPEGNEIVIELADDGAGLDYPRIRSKALALGLLDAGAAADEAQLADCIFAPGFSTAAQLSTMAGRGVGLDVVKTDVGSLGGRIELGAQAGRGTRFRITLPLTLVVSQAVLVRAGGRGYALAASMVAQVQELRPDAMEEIRAQGHCVWQGHNYSWHYLPRLLGDALCEPPPRRRHWLLLLRGAQTQLALEVDELLGSREIVVKNIGAQLARVVGITGATVLGDGEVVLIINPLVLAGRSPGAAEAARQPLVAQGIAPLVMVVDDSLTVRKITGRLLEREGYHVLVAKDGLDALNQMQELTPDVLLADIEMPRMDGFDLARNMRNNPRLKTVPIIAITSRIADKHRNFAQEVGIDHYLGKPYDEDQLLRLIRHLLKVGREQGAAALSA